MQDLGLLRLKILVEEELGRDLDGNELHWLRGLLYFGRACKLKVELDAASEPERIGPVAKRVLTEIKGRIERRRQGRIIEGVKDFLAGQRKPARDCRSKVRTKHVRE